MKVIISVTQADITKARRELKTNKTPRSKCCPVAQSFKRRKIDFDFIVKFAVYFNGSNKSVFPKRVENFINTFDVKNRAKPIRFEIDIPSRFALHVNNLKP